MTDILFKISRVKKSFGTTIALDIDQDQDASINIYRGSTTAILGLSGSGKSTLLNLLNLLESTDEGVQINYYPEKTIDPIRYSDLTTSQKVQMRNEHFGVAFQDGHLIEHIPVVDNVGLPMSLAGASSEGADNVSSSIIEGLKLINRKKSRPKQLSGGEYQRVAVARAMSHDPKVIFCDEPTGNLDTDTSQVVMNMINSWKSKNDSNTLVIVTHNNNQAINNADHYIVLSDGKVQCNFSIEELNTPGKGIWRKRAGIDNNLSGVDALNQLFYSSKKTSDTFKYPDWDKKVTNFRKTTFLLKYGFRDLFPISLSSWSVFFTTLRDTIFSFLTTLSIGVLISVLLMGYGIYSGIVAYQKDVQTRDIRSNRLIIEIQADSEVNSISDELLEDLRNNLSVLSIEEKNMLGMSKNIRKAAIEGVYGYINSELFIHKQNQEKTIASKGTTVDPNSPLLKRLTLNGEVIDFDIIDSDSIEGLILKKSWLKNLGYSEDNIPDNLIINYAGRKETLPLLGICDDLPDGVFLISPKFWHRVRDRNWRPNYKIGRLFFGKIGNISEVESLVRSKLINFEKNDLNPNGLSFELDENQMDNNILYILSNLSNGRSSRWWDEIIYNRNIKKVLDENGIVDHHFIVTSPIYDSPISSDLEYINAVAYLTDIGAVTTVAKMVREHPAKLGVDKYIENAYKRLHQTNQLLLLIFSAVAISVMVLSIVNLILMFYQTVLRKRHEIGILKAFGSTKNKISSIFFIESFYLWMLGSILGLILAYYFGNSSANTLKNIFGLESSNVSLFQLDWYCIYIFISVLFVCQIITYIVTFRHSGKTANELLRQR